MTDVRERSEFQEHWDTSSCCDNRPRKQVSRDLLENGSIESPCRERSSMLKTMSLWSDRTAVEKLLHFSIANKFIDDAKDFSAPSDRN
ncbi:hypothetical protein KIN20_009889 [Parelaphostrongylus tenuis]|uniref:Uncharacterized protein n=1 Tax=Parelaphostrongylus tenuis TaxID=148309 RepID=A0AAD5QLJ1_PARTN|nr:hypothetical protein KIN20_009889 [Parelaphostrongylus tenuis]